MIQCLPKALAAAIAAAREAGDLLRQEFYRPGGPLGPMGKADADLEAENLLRTRLTEAFPQFGFRAEERPQLDTTGQATWLVDPNDGTSAFQRGFRGASVSIALIYEGRPVLGVVNAYAAPDDTGDLLAWAEGCGPITRNGVPLPVRAWPEAPDADQVALITNSADRKPEANAFAVALLRYRSAPGIAYRLALVAAGEGDLGVSLFHPRDFDIAAGHALIVGAGGVLLDERGRTPKYSANHATQLGFCFGGAPALAAEFAQRDWQPLMATERLPMASIVLVRPRIGHLVTDSERWRRGRALWLNTLLADAQGSELAGQLSALGGEAMAYARGLLEGPPAPRPAHAIADVADQLVACADLPEAAPIDPVALRSLLTARPIAGLPNVTRPTPRAQWAVDAELMAERLMTVKL